MARGYRGDYHTLPMANMVDGSPYIRLEKDHEYRYIIRTGSYPLMHHTAALPPANGWINCTAFIDLHGRSYPDWIPAIMLFGE